MTRNWRSQWGESWAAYAPQDCHRLGTRSRTHKLRQLLEYVPNTPRSWQIWKSLYRNTKRNAQNVKVREEAPKTVINKNSQPGLAVIVQQNKSKVVVSKFQYKERTTRDSPMVQLIDVVDALTTRVQHLSQVKP